MKNQLHEIQSRYSEDIKSYLYSIPEIHENYSVHVKFEVDYDLNEYFIISIGEYCRIRLICDVMPTIGFCYPCIFNIDYEMKQVGEILSIIGENIHFVELINLAEKYYFESDNVLKHKLNLRKDYEI